ncbi:MAG TPA: T9SS type A sorting domain-containing protein, partial [Chitinophagaceae bacterium]|nr:T9SS type A sorting domain-containing protein [Chitinophagaceae bacterium]
LSTYNANNEELRLDFRYLIHGANRSSFNDVWIRGSDTEPWIFMSKLSNGASAGEYQLSPSHEIGDSLLKHNQNFSSSFGVRWSQNGSFSATERLGYAGTTIDDIRVYEVFNDAQLKSIDGLSVLNCALATTPVTISVHNGGHPPLTNVPVHYSVNGGPWISEVISVLPGDATIQYNFSNAATLAPAGINVIRAVVSHPLDNFRDNDTAVISIRNVPLISSFPYLQDFEGGDGNWFSEGIKNNWQHGTPASPKIKNAASGQKAWKTNLSGNYENGETAYLYSPCFNTASMAKPTLSFSVALDLEDCGTTLCDAAWMEYSVDGLNWTSLKDNNNSGTNWYNNTGKTYWSIENYTRWHVATVSLPAGLSSIQLRFVLASDPNLTREGIAIDDIHIYDNTKGIYTGPSLSSPVIQNITAGSNWIDFEKDGALIASILPGTQNPGTTGVQAFINPGAVRNTETQYYHDRSFTINSANDSFTDSVGVRIYFPDNETENLLNATGCPGCAKPSSAYRLGVSKYDDPNPALENGSIADNLQGTWDFIDKEKAVKVPFDKGYYAEFKVKGFSEFWLSNGLLGAGTILPVRLLEFKASRDGEDALIQWTVGNEFNVSHYEIEVARNKDELLQNRFQKIGEVKSLGNTIANRTYRFTDMESLKTGTRYYRLKMVDNDGSFTYSNIGSSLFDKEVTWQVAPNPSTGIFYFIHELNSGEIADATLTDITGRLLNRYTLTGSSGGQKLKVDLSQQIYAPGVYLLQVHYKSKLHSFKLYKR